MDFFLARIASNSVDSARKKQAKGGREGGRERGRDEMVASERDGGKEGERSEMLLHLPSSSSSHDSSISAPCSRSHACNVGEGGK